MNFVTHNILTFIVSVSVVPVQIRSLECVLIDLDVSNTALNLIVSAHNKTSTPTLDLCKQRIVFILVFCCGTGKR